MKASSVLAFLAGGAIGAAAVYLTSTEKGREDLKKGLDFIENKLSGITAEDIREEKAE